MKRILTIGLLVVLTACKNNTPAKLPSAPVNDSVTALTEQLRGDDSEGQVMKFETNYTFDTYKAPLYTGKLAAPDFKGNLQAGNPDFVKLVTDGCNAGINFGGKYTIVHKSCGEMCELIILVDRTNGKIYTDTEPKNGSYGYLYKKDSRLLIANSETFQDDTLEYYNDLFATPEIYLWEGKDFKFLQ